MLDDQEKEAEEKAERGQARKEKASNAGKKGRGGRPRSQTLDVLQIASLKKIPRTNSREHGIPQEDPNHSNSTLRDVPAFAT